VLLVLQSSQQAWAAAMGSALQDLLSDLVHAQIVLRDIQAGRLMVALMTLQHQEPITASAIVEAAVLNVVLVLRSGRLELPAQIRAPAGKPLVVSWA
jgi:hypothetical protein